MNTNNFNDTIVAIATPRGEGSISILRISGSLCLDIAKTLTHKTTLTPRYANLLKIFDPQDNSLIDEALVIYFQAPLSFTGEDIVEFQCHGGVGVINILFDRVLTLGARIATPGEFSKRAFLNGKMDLSKAEAIAQLITSKSEDAVKLLAKQLGGELQRFVEAIREDLIFALACSEVGIDYAEEDLPTNLIETIAVKLEKIISVLSKTVDASKRRDGMIDGFKVAIIGKPNVGKSSLLNALLNYERAIVSDIAGTTRDTIEENIKIGTHIIRIVDTAGIRHAYDAIEKIGIERTKKAIEESQIIIGIFDNSQTLDKEDEIIIQLLQQSCKESIYVINKLDLPSQLDTSHFPSNLKLSCKNDIQPLIEQLQVILDTRTSVDEMMLISKRQIQCVTYAMEDILKAQTLLKNGELELFSHHLKEAIDHISAISRPFDNDQMLDVMFNSFCLGK